MLKSLLFALSAVVGILWTPTSYGQEDPGPAGRWKGALELGDVKVTLVFNIDRSETGDLTATMDSPDQGAMGLPISEATFNDDILTLKSDAVRGVFKGRLADSGSGLAGSWTQGGREFELTLKKSDPIEAPRRPQEPKPPFPYESVEVRYPNPQDSIELAGTLTYPSSGGPFPAVVLVTGSGPQDRDESLLGHKPFAVIADHLTRQGIAVLRFDDRGVGSSTGRHPAATTAEFALDALASVRFLVGREEIDPGRIGVVGHSEGGLIASMAAVQSSDIAFVAMLAAPGINGEEILYLQNDLINLARGSTEAEIQENLASMRRLIAVAKSAASTEAAKGAIDSTLDEMIAELSESQKQAAGISPDPEAWKKGTISRMSSPWMRCFLTLDPAATLRQLKIPVLAICGENDLQVPPKENLGAISAALEMAGNPDYTTLELEGLNHLFQTSETGAPAEYGKIEETFSPAALKILSDWIVERFGS